MRIINVIGLILINIIVVGNLNAQKKSFYDFSVITIDGEIFDFSNLKGKKVLIVNTASECGNTPQYKDMEELYKLYGGEKFIIIGFPANNFGSQEPGTDEQIREFCDVNYKITFPMMSKISVKGDDMHPLYKWLTTKEENGVMDSSVKWNFQKYLIDESGNLAGVVAPKENPLSDKIVNWIKGSVLIN